MICFTQRPNFVRVRAVIKFSHSLPTLSIWCKCPPSTTSKIHHTYIHWTHTSPAALCLSSLMVDTAASRCIQFLNTFLGVQGHGAGERTKLRCLHASSRTWNPIVSVPYFLIIIVFYHYCMSCEWHIIKKYTFDPQKYNSQNILSGFKILKCWFFIEKILKLATCS